MSVQVAARTTAPAPGLADLLARRAPASGTGHDRTRRLCAQLGLDPTAVATIHVTGTNGKSSTSRMVDDLARAAGLHTMRFTSPHLHHPGERIVVDGEVLAPALLAREWDRIRPVVEHLDATGAGPGFFDVMTAIFLGLSPRVVPDVAIVEVGRGGRDDATNVCAADVAVFTPIGGDHPDLGATPAALAATKLGIVTHGGRRPGGPRMVSGPQRPDVAALLARTADAHDLPSVVVVGSDAQLFPGSALRRIAATPTGQRLDLATGVAHHPIDFPVHGSHMADNAALALAAVEAFLGRRPESEVVCATLAATRLPGRLEHRTSGGVDVWLDGAHNPTGATALAAALADRPRVGPAGTRVLVLGCAGDKDVGGIVAALRPVVDAVVATTVPSRATMPAGQAAAAAVRAGLATRTVPDPVAALGTAVEVAGTGGDVVVCGSLHLVGGLRAVTTTAPGSVTAGAGREHVLVEAGGIPVSDGRTNEIRTLPESGAAI